MVRTYRDLSVAEKELLRASLQERLNIAFPDVAAMEDELASPMFADGAGLFAWWDGEEVGGTLAVISKELASKGEVYMTWLSAPADRTVVLDELLAAALAHCGELQPQKVRLGVGARYANLHEPILQRGFRPGGEAVILVKAAEEVPQTANCRAVPLTESNAEQYLELRNPSFVMAPNSNVLSEADVREKAAAHKGDLCGILCAKDMPVGTFEVSMRDKTGVIDEIAVAREHQGKGYGQLLLDYVQNLLVAKGAERLELLVFTSNTRAMGLYTKSGFVQERLNSTWFDYAG
jgi:ribosomal protein S18 acetylase RimI-like enzyme